MVTQPRKPHTPPEGRTTRTPRNTHTTRVTRILRTRPRLWASIMLGLFVFGLLTATALLHVTSRT